MKKINNELLHTNRLSRELTKGLAYVHCEKNEQKRLLVFCKWYF